VIARAAIKICGVTRVVDAERAAAAGVELVGLNLWPRSKRYVTVDQAGVLAAAVRASGPARVVGVFVDASAAEIADAVARAQLDVVQLHGAETPAELATIAAVAARPAWKAIAVAASDDVADLAAWPAEAILLDTPTPGRGGSGTAFDWSLARAAVVCDRARRIVLAGGLTADNVARAIAEVGPWAVDVASGVEASPGVKDAGKLAAFVAAVRAGP
jgi:phosphoribosylanthranilate isomerase